MLKQSLITMAVLMMLVSSASALDPSCDPTGHRYAEMLKNGKLFSKQDEACFGAVMSARNEAERKAMRIPKVTTAPAPSWRKLGKESEPASAPKH